MQKGDFMDNEVTEYTGSEEEDDDELEELMSQAIDEYAESILNTDTGRVSIIIDTDGKTMKEKVNGEAGGIIKALAEFTYSIARHMDMDPLTVAETVWTLITKTYDDYLDELDEDEDSEEDEDDDIDDDTDAEIISHEDILPEGVDTSLWD